MKPSATEVNMEQRTLQIGDRTIYCYEDGSVEFLSEAVCSKNHPMVRTTGYTVSRGYKAIRLKINGERKSLLIHRIIALAFHPNPNGMPEVDHINRDKTDNRPCNLRWVNSSTNNSNRDCVDRSLAKYGVRFCDDQKAYYKAREQHRLTMRKPDGSCSRTRALTPEVYSILEPLSQKERFLRYEELKNA